jgi:hypothetical protein
LNELRLVGHAGLLRHAPRQLDHVLVPFDAHAARAALGGSDDVAAIAGAKVHHEILGGHLRHIEHLLHQH